LIGQDKGLLIYNFQPILQIKGLLFCSLDTLIRPLSEIDCTDINSGIPFQFFINGKTTEVMNITQGLLCIELTSPEEIKEEEMDEPIIYGKYKDYSTLCSFAAIKNKEPMSFQAIYRGEYNQTLSTQNINCFDSMVEARDYLLEHEEEHIYIVEFKGPKEELSDYLKSQTNGDKFVKIFDLQSGSIDTHPKQTEHNIEDEIARVEEAILEPLTALSISDISDSDDVEK